LRDASTTPLNFTRSINLALSERGINALRSSESPELLQSILAETIPMHGRMIHSQDKQGGLTEAAQQYDIHGQSIKAVDRGNLNGLLLDELESLPNVKLRFYHKLTGIDFRRRLAWLEQKGPSRRQSTVGKEDSPRPSGRPGRPDEIEIDFDFILGCDGAHSSVRFHMMKFARVDFAQTYIDTLWCEFQIPPAGEGTSTTPSAKDGFATSPNHLHIWPGSDKMFIAIPSVDKSFTSTLFAPYEDFLALESDPSKVELFFNQNFPGAVDLIGPGEIRNQFMTNPHLPLISVKCSPHVFESSGVILGDAAHAMVPFYGQGMNAGLEDVRVLFSHLDSQPTSSEGRAKALESYNTERIADAHSINDLSLANYWEMHVGVNSTIHLLRKKIEEFLSDKLPSTGFATQYSRVSFSNQRYSEVVKVVARQKTILLRGMLGSALLPVAGWVGWIAWRWHRGRSAPNLLMRGVGFAVERVAKIFRW
jgi:kynurenine 3-monooxygenase